MANCSPLGAKRKTGCSIHIRPKSSVPVGFAPQPQQKRSFGLTHCQGGYLDRGRGLPFAAVWSKVIEGRQSGSSLELGHVTCQRGN